MEHYKVDVLLCEPTKGSYQLFFKGIGYKPTDNPTAAGVLLFGLRPRGIKFKCKSNPECFISLAQGAAYMLHLHANRYKVSADGPRQLTLEKLHEWVNDAVALAPDDESAQSARDLINENLGPYAYED